MKISAFKVFTPKQQTAVKSAIVEAEMTTSGEIRLFIDDHCAKSDPLEKAVVIFQKLKMDQTNLRNGVLVYLSIADRKFAIIGDKGINEKVADDFWNETKDLMLSHFKKDQISEGLIAGIKKIGADLSFHFPRQNDDKNEMSNDIVFRD